MSNSFVTPWTVARQAPLSVRFPRQEYWRGCHFLLWGLFPTQGSNTHLLNWQVNSLTLRHQGSPSRLYTKINLRLSHRFSPWVRKIPWRRKWQPTPVFLYGKSQGQRSLVGHSPWGCERVRYDLATKQQQQQRFIYVVENITVPKKTWLNSLCS